MSLENQLALLEGIAKHSDCSFLRGVIFGIAYAEEALKEQSQQAPQPTAVPSRSQGQRAAWERLTPEQREDRVRRMLAGRRTATQKAVEAPATPTAPPSTPSQGNPMAAACARAAAPPPPPSAQTALPATTADKRSKQEQAHDLFKQGKPVHIVAAHINVSLREAQTMRNKWEAERLLG